MEGDIYCPYCHVSNEPRELVNGRYLMVCEHCLKEFAVYTNISFETERMEDEEFYDYETEEL